MVNKRVGVEASRRVDLTKISPVKVLDNAIVDEEVQLLSLC